MATPLLSETLAKADIETLKEIIREAESYLSAQLTSTLAANQRAMTFTTVISAAAAVIVGAAGSLLLGDIERWPLGGIGVAVSGGFLFAVWIAMGAAAPSAFGFVGNTPSEWAADVEAYLPMNVSLAQQCQHYDENIFRNIERMEDSKKKLLLAMRVVFWTTVCGIIAAIAAICPLEFLRLR
jgi:hypothetical protein